MPDDPGPLDLPERVGRYALGPVLGIGGFAVVIRAADEMLDAQVAVKILTPRHALDPEVRERFVREARMLRRVRSPSVVTVHDVGETEDGRPYLVMDLAEGGVLEDRLATATAPPDPETLRTLVSTLAEGLGALHVAGVVHRDLKPANLLILRGPGFAPGASSPGGALLQPGEHLAIGDLGLAKDQLASAYGPTMVGGTPGYQAPEQQEVGGRIDARTDVYAASALLWRVLTGQQPPPADEIPVRLLDLPESWRPVLERGMAADPRERHASMAQWAEAVAGLIGVSDSSTVPSPAAAAAEGTLPYKGLAGFQSGDAALFFGRRELVDRLVARLQQASVLVIGGASGSGKSSLLRAGLLPALAGGALPGSKQWLVCLMTPGERPLDALLHGLRQVPGAAGEMPGSDELVARPALVRSCAPDQLVLAVDQLEELFTQCRERRHREAFLAALEALTAGPQPRALVVLALRADFYGTCAAYPWLVAAINRGQVLVGPMDRTQLSEAIEGPARRVGLHLERGLVDRVLSDAGEDAGALPLVSHALVETWLRREGDLLTLAGYREAGGVAGAIARSADAVWDELDAAEQEAAHRLFARLVHPGDGVPDTKRKVAWSEVGGDEVTRSVVSRFAAGRLLSVDEQGVELAHEALLRSWPRLVRWIDANRDDLRQGERLAAAAREWERQGRLDDLLYRGLPLATALELRDRRAGVLDSVTTGFLQASQDARVRRERQAHAEAERLARLRRRVLVVMSVLTALALTASVVAGIAMFRSQQDAEAARQANRVAAEQLARGLAASSLDLRQSNPYLAVVLAAEAVARIDPALPEAQDALVHSRMALAGEGLVPVGDPVSVGDAIALAVAPRGDSAATGNRDGTVDVWDLERRERTGRLMGPAGGVQDLAFSLDGRWIVGAGDEGRLWRWSRSGGDSTGEVLADLESVVWAVAPDPLGGVAAVTGAGEVWLLDVSSGQTEAVLEPGGGELLSVAYSPDGGTLLAGSGRGEVFAWSRPGNEPRFGPVPAHTSDVWELLVRQAGDGESFVTVSSDGTARLWDLATGAAVPGSPFDAESEVPTGVRGATLGPDHQVLTLGGPEGALYEWSIAERRLVRRSGPFHRDRVTWAARSDDQRTMVTLSDDRTIQLWTQRPRPSPIEVVASLESTPRSMDLSTAGLLAVGAEDGAVHLIDREGAPAGRLEGHGGAVTAVVFVGEGRLVSGDEEGGLRLWDVPGGAVLAEQPGAHTSVGALTAGGEVFVSGGGDGVVRRWDPASLEARGEPLGRLRAPVTDLSTGGDSGVAAATNLGDIALWTADGRLRAGFSALDNTVWAAALDDTEEILAVAGADEILSVWSLEEQDPSLLHELGSHRGGALAAVFVDPDTVAGGSAEGLVQLWHVRSGRPIGPGLEVSQSPIRHLVTEGSVLWAAGRDGSIVRIDALDRQAACAAAGWSFDERQQQRLLAGRPLEAC